MSEFIRACVSIMFADCDPSFVSGSQFELGESAGSLTWSNAMAIAEFADRWLDSDRSAAVAGVREYASHFGAWTEQEINAWTEQECLAFLVQDVAHELRMLGSDTTENLSRCVRKYERTDWEKESECPHHGYYTRRRMMDGRRKTLAMVEYYTGM